MSKVGVHIIGGVLVIPRTRGTNPCIGLAVSQDPRAPRVWGSMGHARAPYGLARSKNNNFFSASATRASRGRPTYVLRPEERYTQRRRMRLVQTVPRAAADALRYPTLRGPTATEVAAEMDYRMSIM